MNLTERRIGWIKKLRSGKYLQGKNALKNSNPEYCCIGVYLEGRGDVEWRFSPASGNDDRPRLYYIFQEDLEVGPEMQNHLINMNDERNRDFNFIARFLEVAWKL